MLARLVQGAASISDLGRPFLKKMSLPAITKHVKVLERTGLITKTREALRSVDDWMEQYRVLREEQFDRLNEYLKTVTSKQTPKAKADHATARSNELKITRVYDAPVRLVWEAWTDDAIDAVESLTLHTRFNERCDDFRKRHRAGESVTGYRKDDLCVHTSHPTESLGRFDRISSIHKKTRCREHSAEALPHLRGVRKRRIAIDFGMRTLKAGQFTDRHLDNKPGSIII